MGSLNDRPERKNRAGWHLWLASLVLAGEVLVGVGWLVIHLKPYWVARYHGRMASLRGAELPGAPLEGVDLTQADLRKANLRSANLTSASLYWTHLEGANLAHVNLRGAHLFYTQLAHADLRAADLEEAGLCTTELEGADLRGADLQDACFFGAGSISEGVDLSGADLRGADLRVTGLDKRYLTGARYNARTRWPSGFNPALYGAILVK